MAKKSMVLKNLKRLKTNPIRHRNRCKLCGRSRAYIRIFGLCRLCFRHQAQEGNLPGVVKASW